MNTKFPQLTSLNNLAEGETGQIVLVRGKPEMHRYFSGMGLVMGQSVSGLAASLDDSSVTIKAGDKIAIIERDLAKNIKIKR
jgi:Fe2+ transport system protein FeoA